MLTSLPLTLGLGFSLGLSLGASSVHASSGSISSSQLPPPAQLIRTSFPPSASPSLPACMREAYYGAYGGSAGAQDHLYHPDIECISSMQAMMDELDLGRSPVFEEDAAARSRERIKVYSKGGEEDAFEYQDLETTFRGAARYFWVGPAGVEPELIESVWLGEEQWQVQEKDVEGALEKRQQKPLTIPSHAQMRLEIEPEPKPNTDGYIAKADPNADPIADGIRRRLWAVAHEGLPEHMKGKMFAFDAITVTPLHTSLSTSSRSPSSYLISMPPNARLAGLIDTALPPHLVPVALPLKPLRIAHDADSDANPHEGTTTIMAVPVPQERADYLRNITDALKFDPALDRAIAQGLDEGQLRRDVRWLTGEAPSGWESRHSFTQGARDAADWIKSQVESTGANCTHQPFLPGFSPNVICTYPSTASKSTKHNETNDDGEEVVIFSAHYDSRGSFGSTVAPGGDDDGSGSGHLLAIARAIGKVGAQFEKKVVLAWFAEKLYERNATVLLQVQADMLGYHVPGEPLQLGLPESIALPEASDLLSSLARMYAPSLVIGTTAACCSDHQSFLSLGFPATQVFERNGRIADPMYHNSGDASNREGYDFEQVREIAKVTMAALFTVAGWKV